MEEKIEGTIEVKGRRGKRCKQLLDNPRKNFILEIKRQALDRNVSRTWKRQWTCRKIDCEMNE
jgi:hypothetical protein